MSAPTTAPLAGFPFTEKTVDIDGHTMAYVDEGTGPPVLHVHGNPTWSFYYRSLLSTLPDDGLRAIAPDHIGMGRSDKPAPADYPHTLARRVADLTALVEHLALEKPLHLVVHDWGGPIGLSWAVEHLDQVDKVVVLNTGAFPLPDDKRIPWSLQAARLPVIGDVAVRRFNAFSVGALAMGSGKRWLGAEARRGLLAPYDSPAHRVAVHAFVQDIPTGPDDPAHPVLARLASRLHLLDEHDVQVHWGMKDPVFDDVILRHLERHLPGADVHRYPDAGHYVLEDAADEIVPAVRTFLAAGR